MDLTRMTLEDQLTILKELEASKGWSLLAHFMEESIVDAAMSMANGTPMPPEQFNFHRGAMWSAKKLIELPKTLRLQLENKLLLSQADLQRAEKLSQKVSLRPDTTKKD